MVRLCCFFLLLIFFSVSGLADEQPKLSVKPDKTQVEMGKYFSVSLIYIGKTIPDISHLQKWYHDFYIDRRDTEAEDLSNGLIQYTENLRLYPRSTGKKVLHAIAMGGAIASPVMLNVVPIVRKGIDAAPQWQLLPDTIWQGETIKVSVIQNLLHQSNTVVVDNVSFPGFSVHALEQEIISIDHIKKIKLSWLITAQSYGVHQLELPSIVQRGRGRWRFYLPRMQIAVKPLPSYIPPTVPVGKLSIQTGLISDKNKLFWFVDLQNEGFFPEEIYGIRKQLADLAGIAVEMVKLFHTQSAPEVPKGYIQRYQFPIPDWSFGTAKGDKVSISYFDVHEGRILKISNTLPRVWSIPVLGQNLFYIFLLFILCGLVWSLYKGWKKRLNRKNFLSLLNQIRHSYELRQLLLSQADCYTLDEWSLKQSSSNKKNQAKSIANQLNSLCYARSSQISLSDIKQQLVQLYSMK